MPLDRLVPPDGDLDSAWDVKPADVLTANEQPIAAFGGRSRSVAVVARGDRKLMTGLWNTEVAVRTPVLVGPGSAERVRVRGLRAEVHTCIRDRLAAVIE
jgi:hypothetical protein